MDRRFKIFEKSGRKWNVITDISQILFQYLSSRPTEKLHTKSPTCSKEEASLRNARSKCYSLATSCWSWGEEELFTGQMSGHVIQYSVSRDAETRVKAVYKTQLKEISCIKYCTVSSVSGDAGILIVCGSDGRVEVLKVGRNISSLGYLWEDLDRLVVSKIVIVSNRIDELSLVLAKGSFCIQLVLRILNGSKIEIKKPSVKNTGMTRIVGLECHHDKLVYVNQNSPVQICDTDQLRSSDCVSLEVSRDNYFCQGMAASHSGTVFACLDNISTFNDHLIVREPGRLVFWTLDSEESVKRRMVERSEDLTRSADILECYRILLSPTDDSRSVLNLNLPVSVRWWHYRALLSKTSDAGVREWLSTRVTECEAQLRCETAIRRIRDNKISQSDRTASAIFIKQFSKNKDFLDEVDTIFDQKLPVSDWICRISGEAEDETQPEVSVVISRGGHTWPRCVTSQRAVDCTRPGTCGWCKSLTHSTHLVRCCLCGGPVSR